MAYCSLTDLLNMISQEELAQLTSDAGEVPDSLVAAEAIAWADSEIDASAGRRYPVPLNPVPEVIRGVAVDLALYHLYSRRSVIPPVRRRRYEEARAFLHRVAAGEAWLAGGDGSATGSGSDPVTMSSAGRLFSRKDLGDW
jgi:phage gp36-like protein